MRAYVTNPFDEAVEVVTLEPHIGSNRRAHERLPRAAARPLRRPGQRRIARPTGFDLVANATPMGMRADDSYPVDVVKLVPGAFVGDTVTEPVIPPLMEAARRIGCTTSTGGDVFATVADLIVDFLLVDGPLRSQR